MGWGAVTANINGPGINADSSKRNVSRILSFKIGGNVSLLPLQALPAPPPVADDFGSDAQIQAGAVMYRRNCVICHGIDAVSGGVLPDVRHSAFNASQDAWKGVLIDGALQDLGMVSFAEILSVQDAESIRAYVVRRANESTN